jgi:hypothetical protein
MHYISVKQEHGVPRPGQLFDAECYDIADTVVERKKIVEVIDLCDSDNESTEGNPPGSSSAGTPDCNPNDDDSNIVTPNKTQADIPAMQSRPESGTRLLATSQARTSSKSKMVSGNVMPKPVEAVSATATAPATDVPPVPRSYWRKRLDVPGQSESTATPNHDTNTTNPSASATSPATTCTPGSAKTKVKKRTPKPKHDHSHKYRGPEITVLSLRAIWDHLDRAWKQASCTVQTINRHKSWWNTNVVVAAHQLDKHQVYLLLFAQSKWWQALEEQWTKYDALPTKDRKVIMKMREVRLRKESFAVKYEAALVNEGIIKDHDAVYMLGSGVKKEKMDQEDDKEKVVGEKRKRAGPGDGEGEKEDEDAKNKRVRFGSGEAVDKVVEGDKKGEAGEEDVDDVLSSDSDEEED